MTSATPLWEASPAGTLARQVALVLDELAQARGLHRQLELGLLRTECALDTELFQPLPPGDRARLQGHLLGLDAERRRLAMAEHEALRALHGRLLDLLNKYAYVAPDHED